jgi:hypothetical protein
VEVQEKRAGIQALSADPGEEKNGGEEKKWSATSKREGRVDR